MRTIAFIIVLSLLAGGGWAFQPAGWLYIQWPYAYSMNENAWYGMSEPCAQWCIGLPDGAWRLLSKTGVAMGWTYFQWPYGYSSTAGGWFYMDANSEQWCINLSDAQWSKFGQALRVVDPGTMRGKLLMGYQGWFACPGDGSQPNRWLHWFLNDYPVAASARVDVWPDISELEADELFATGMTLPDGRPARVYSAFKQKTVARHFKWMQEHQLDGVLLQRFVSELSNAAFFSLRNRVTLNVQLGAEAYGRVFAIMYDISGQRTDTLYGALAGDWAFLVNTLRVTGSPRYLRHNGKPVVVIWGFGFSGRPDTPQQARDVIAFFKAAGCAVVGGVPAYWRTLTNDSQTDPAWAEVFRSFDIVSPWSVGRYVDNKGADSFMEEVIVPDLADVTSAGREYLPVVFPGFSWHNLTGDPINWIPRHGGAFYWRQVYNAIGAGSAMIYGAMFDEMDEGTAMFKLAPTAAELPAQGAFVPMNIDGIDLPSDWYLRLADQASRMLRAEIPLQPTMPIQP